MNTVYLQQNIFYALAVTVNINVNKTT